MAVLNRQYSSSTELLLFCLVILLTFSIQPVRSESDSGSREEPVQWRFLTKHNISSLLRLNPHLLILVREPNTLWSEAERRAWNKKLFKDAPDESKMQVGNHEITLIRIRTPTKTYTQQFGIDNENVPRMPYGPSGARHEIIPGSILIATEELAEVYPFDRSRILIVKANQSTGFQGLILNKLMPWDLIKSLEEGLEPMKDVPLSYGGLLITPGRPLVSLTLQSVGDEHPEVLPGIYFLDQSATFNLRQNLTSHDLSMTDCWFFAGYSAWGWSQLYDEVADGAWSIINGTLQQLDWPMI